MAKVQPSDTVEEQLRTHPDLPSIKSAPVNGDESTRMNLNVPDETQLLSYAYEDAQTIYSCLLRGCKASGNGEFLGSRSSPDEAYTWITYRQVIDRAQAVGSGLVSLGATPKKSVIGIFSQNRPEYLVVEYGCYSFSMVLAPLYDTLGIAAVQHIVQQTEMQIVIVDNEKKIRSLLSTTGGSLKHVICITDDVTEETKSELEERGMQYLSLNDLELLGKDAELEPTVPEPDDLAVICYTSGTTGVPKGVMSTHRNYVSSSSSILVEMSESGLEIGNTDTHISYLPLAHSYERLAITTLMMNGGKVGFFGGDILKLTDDIKALKPTIFSTVPRLLNRLYDQVNGTVRAAGCLKKLIFNSALQGKQKDLEKGTIKSGTLADKIAFKRVQAGLGGCIRFIATGSAPLSSAVMDFTRCVAGAPVVEGYGQTENAGAACCTLLKENNSGVVGVPLRCCMIKLADIPDMKYFAADQKGEVCIKGHNVFKGYYKDKEKTSETVDADGWLHTGDVGQWTKDGCLKIIDRKKHIFKLSQGEYVAPEKIENIYIRCPALAQMFVFGNSLKSTLVGVGFVDSDKFSEWVVEKTGSYGNVKDLCKEEKVIQCVLDDLTEIGKQAGLKSFEQVKKIRLEAEVMSVENGLLTPTLKTKRADVATKYKEDLEKLYEGLN